MATSNLSQRYKDINQNNHITPPQHEEPDSHGTTASDPNSSSQPSHTSETTTSPVTSNPTAQGWSPKLDRRQSWDAQEMRHQMQERLLGPERGKETGFTEMEGHGGRNR